MEKSVAAIKDTRLFDCKAIGTSSFVLSAIIRWNPIPTPSITARKTPHMMAEFRAALTPPRTARAPPVKKPAMTKTGQHLCSRMTIPARHTGIVGILLLPDTLDGTIKCREHATPDTKVPTENRCSRLDRSEGTYPALTIGAVSKPFDTMPDSTTNGLSAEKKESVGLSITNELRDELSAEHTPMQKAPPKSLSATQGQGSRE